MRTFMVTIGIMAAGLLSITGCDPAGGSDAMPGSPTAPMRAADGTMGAPVPMTHLLVATLQGRVVCEFSAAEEIEPILAFLTEAQRAVLARKGVVSMEDPAEVTALSVLAGFDPASVGEGVLIAPYSAATWGRVKCCYSDKVGSGKCCPQKKKRKEG